MHAINRKAIGTWPLQVHGCSEYIGSLTLSPDEQEIVVAGGNGTLSLLDVRKAGETLSEVDVGCPLLCCETDGQTAVAGAQNGQVRLGPLGAYIFECRNVHDADLQPNSCS